MDSTASSCNLGQRHAAHAAPEKLPGIGSLLNGCPMHHLVIRLGTMTSAEQHPELITAKTEKCDVPHHDWLTSGPTVHKL